MQISNLASWLAIIIASIAFEVLGNPTAPVGLLVNGVSEPLAIDRDATRFKWQLTDGGRGERQTAYHILVSSSAERLAKSKADYWDSGKVCLLYTSDAADDLLCVDLGGR